MSIAANLDINLRASTDRLEKGLKRSEERLGFFQRAVSGVANSVRRAFSAMGTPTLLQKFMSQFEGGAEITEGLEIAKEAVGEFGKSLLEVMDKAADGVKDIFKELYKSTVHVFKAMGQAAHGVVEIVFGIVQALTAQFGTLLKGVEDLVSGVAKAAFGVLESILTSVWGLLKTAFNTVLGLGKSVWDLFKNLTESVRKFAQAIIQMGLAGINNIAGISLSSKRLRVPFNDLVVMAMKAKTQVADLEPVINHILTDLSQNPDELDKALRRVNLNARELRNMDFMPMMEKIADAVNEIDNAADRLALIRELAGKYGEHIALLFEGGSEAMREMKHEAKELGLTLSQVDQEAVGRAKKSITHLKHQWEGFINSVAVAIAPAVEAFNEMAGKIFKWFQDHKEMCRDWGAGLGEVIKEWKTLWEKVPPLFKAGWELVKAESFVVWDEITDYLKSVFLEAVIKICKIFESALVTISMLPTTLAIGGIAAVSAMFSDSEKKTRLVAAAPAEALNRIRARNDALNDFKNKAKDLWDTISNAWNKDKEKRNDSTGEAFDQTKPSNKAEGKDHKDNAAALANTDEAFRVIARNQGDKMYSVANKQLATLLRMLGVLKDIKHNKPKPNVKDGRFT